MAKAKINPAFTYKTRDVQEVTNLRTNSGDSVYPFIAEVVGIPRTYTARGYYYPDAGLCCFDLIKQPVKKVKQTKTELPSNSNVARQPNDIPEVNIPHKYHDLIVAWAKNPNIKIQFKSNYEPYDWKDIVQPSWEVEYEWRIKPEEPKLLTIIGADGKARSYPEPCKVKPSLETNHYFPIFSTKNLVFTDCYIWLNDETDSMLFNKSFIHLQKEAAELHAKAMLGID